MKGAIVLRRKSTFYPTPVLCAVFEYEVPWTTPAEQVIQTWISEFLRKFPEFKDTEFSQEYTDLL